MTEQKTIQEQARDYIDSCSENWQRSSFIDRLETARSMVDAEGFPTGAADILVGFLALTPQARTTLIQSLRVRNQVLDWAQTADTSDIQALAADMQALIQE